MPELPPPTREEARKPVPRSMAELVFTPSKSSAEANTGEVTRFGFIKMMRVKALNLELSWRLELHSTLLYRNMCLILVLQHYRVQNEVVHPRHAH